MALVAGCLGIIILRMKGVPNAQIGDAGNRGKSPSANPHSRHPYAVSFASLAFTDDHNQTTAGCIGSRHRDEWPPVLAGTTGSPGGEGRWWGFGGRRAPPRPQTLPPPIRPPVPSSRHGTHS